jgi:hypothetical protein
LCLQVCLSFCSYWRWWWPPLFSFFQLSHLSFLSWCVFFHLSFLSPLSFAIYFSSFVLVSRLSLVIISQLFQNLKFSSFMLPVMVISTPFLF